MARQRFPGESDAAPSGAAAERSGHSRRGSKRLAKGVRTDFAAVLGLPSVEGVYVSTYSIGTGDFVVFSFRHDPTQGERGEAERSLSSAERDIAMRIVAGESNGEIARSRSTSPRTIANQIVSIYRKLGIRSRRELAALRFQWSVASS